MAKIVRQSKFRHVYGKPKKREECYDDVKVTANTHDSVFCSINPKFLAVVTESGGGGMFVVIPVNKVGRVDRDYPGIAGHKGAVLDIKWCPFNDNIIASCSEDCTIKIWNIPDGGLLGRSNLTEAVVDLHGHQKKVMYVNWHPTAANVLLSASADNHIVIWNCGMGQAMVDIDCHPNLIQSVSWNYDGSRFVSSCKDGQIRVINPRDGKVLKQFKGHGGGTKSTQVTFLKNGQVFSTGFSKSSEREYALWDAQKGMFKVMETIDQSNGVLFHSYDVDTGMIYLIGKGDSVVRYYEINADLPYVHYISMFQSASPQRGMGVMPKRGCDPSICEIARLFKLHTKGLIEVIPMICPRKVNASEIFQEDLYPDTIGDTPALTAEEWFEGKDAEPSLMSMRDLMTTTTSPKIKVASLNAPKPNLLAALACGTKETNEPKEKQEKRPAQATPSQATDPTKTDVVSEYRDFIGVKEPAADENKSVAPPSASSVAPTPANPLEAQSSSKLLEAPRSSSKPLEAPASKGAYSQGFDTSVKTVVKLGPSKEEFEELVEEIKKLKVVVFRQEKKMEALETRITDFDKIIKEATSFQLANGDHEEDG